MASAPKTLAAFLKRERPGARLVYHVGYLASDRKKKKAVDKLASEVMAAYEAGKVAIFQSKMPGTDVYWYFAEKK